MAESSNTCMTVSTWTSQVLLWIFITLVFLSFTLNWEGIEVLTITFLVIIYIAHLILNFYTNISSYLYNKHKSDFIFPYMKGLFYSPANLTWHADNYHWVVTHTKNGTSRRKSYTSRVTKDFKYYSWRDISGLFKLDEEKVKNENKTYIKLELSIGIELADDMTKLDYQMQKDNFYAQEKGKDVCMDFYETKSLINFNQFNLIKITESEPCGVNFCMFVFFLVFTPFIEFYKMYVNYFCVDQDYEIKKAVSTRYDLNSQELRSQFLERSPTIILPNHPPVAYDEAPQPVHNTPQLPSMEELEQARQMEFNNKIGFNFIPVDNYQPIFTGVQSNIPITIQSDNLNLNDNIINNEVVPLPIINKEEVKLNVEMEDKIPKNLN